MKRGWTISQVDDPAVIVENSHLFDNPVSHESAVDFVNRPAHLLLLATTRDGEGIGFVTGVEMRHPDKPAEMFIYELGVDIGWRRRGVAKSLLNALTDEARRRGCRGMWTGAERNNPAAMATYRAMRAKVDPQSVIVTWQS